MPPRKKDGEEFQVHRNAAVKVTARKPRAKQPPAPPPEPVKITQVHPKALSVADDLARGRDVHLVLNADGSVTIRNGKRE